MPLTVDSVPMEFYDLGLDLYLDGVLMGSAELHFLDARGAVVFNLTLHGQARTVTLTTDFVVRLKL